MAHLDDVLKIKGEFICNHKDKIDRDKLLVDFKEWLDSKGLTFGGDFRPYITDDEFQARFDIGHDCVEFRNDLKAIEIKKQWERDLIIKKLKEKDMEITEDNIEKYDGKLFDTYEEALKWHEDLIKAQQDEFIMA
jgi:hypothetical protein